ncbi:hypothetical protein [Paraburkholderia phytofirmans]|uniref:hypothetical protein n=1 Tax=Paraburkholderia phytofirmans TaxID=261302 RepID=UPI0013149E5F|nr:hypothetical protein [Paraburkholderia phytofirmans]
MLETKGTPPIVQHHQTESDVQELEYPDRQIVVEQAAYPTLDENRKRRMHDKHRIG